MGQKIEITALRSREILDSRGTPTLTTTVYVQSAGTTFQGTASVPSGASTGKLEAVELRDGDSARYGGKGVLKAVGHVNGKLATALNGFNVRDQKALDDKLRKLDGTENFASLGANAALSVSLAAARACAAALDIPLWQHLGGISAQSDRFPMPMFNIINGGKHADNDLDVQEFMIVPVGASRFSQAMEYAYAVMHSLRTLLRSRGLSTAVGDEGGFAPNLKRTDDALSLLCEAIEAAGLRPGDDVALAIDAAASEWVQGDGTYRLPKANRTWSGSQLLRKWRYYTAAYPLISIEDGVGEEDGTLWRQMTERMGGKTILVGDDLFVTNPKRLQLGIREGWANAVLVKPNQIGTLTDTLQFIDQAKRAGKKVVISHRSGETEDAFIADLAYGLGADFLKAGAPCRGERTAKYNRMLALCSGTAD